MGFAYIGGQAIVRGGATGGGQHPVPHIEADQRRRGAIGP
jgi:hypothetical protein